MKTLDFMPRLKKLLSVRISAHLQSLASTPLSTPSLAPRCSRNKVVSLALKVPRGSPHYTSPCLLPHSTFLSVAAALELFQKILSNY